MENNTLVPVDLRRFALAAAQQIAGEGGCDVSVRHILDAADDIAQWLAFGIRKPE